MKERNGRLKWKKSIWLSWREKILHIHFSQRLEKWFYFFSASRWQDVTKDHFNKGNPNTCYNVGSNNSPVTRTVGFTGIGITNDSCSFAHEGDSDGTSCVSKPGTSQLYFQSCSVRRQKPNWDALSPRHCEMKCSLSTRLQILHFDPSQKPENRFYFLSPLEKQCRPW